MGMLDNDYTPPFTPRGGDFLGWRALLENRCPKCQEELLINTEYGEFIRCTACDFKINEDRFRELKEELEEQD